MTNNTLNSKLLKEPLFHFILIGFALFFLYAKLNSEEKSSDKAQIVVNASTMSLLSTTFTEENGRAPTTKEMQTLLENDIREAVLYHEAMSLGLDKGDRIIRHRLAQKMQYLFEDLTDINEEAQESSENNDSVYESLKSRYEIILDDAAAKILNESEAK